MKGAFARLGIRGFKPELRKAPQKLAALRTPENVALPPNTLAEIERDMARLAVVREQIEAIERTRLERLQQAPTDSPNAMVLLLARIIGLGVETADMLVQEVLSRNFRDRRAVARYAGATGSPDESGSMPRSQSHAPGGPSRPPPRPRGRGLAGGDGAAGRDPRWRGPDRRHGLGAGRGVGAAPRSPAAEATDGGVGRGRCGCSRIQGRGGGKRAERRAALGALPVV